VTTHNAETVSLRRLRLKGYKTFAAFDLQFRGDTFLVGPNNAGKSTLIEAMQGASVMLRYAAQRRPEFTRQDDGNLVWAYTLTTQRNEVETENLRHNFRNAEARLVLELSNDTVLTAVWPPSIDDEGSPTGDASYFFVRVKGTSFKYRDRPRTWRSRHVDIGVVPTLSPVLRRERLLADDYLASSIRTRRVSQHLRNHILRLDYGDEFDDFLQFVLEHMPEVDHLEVSTSRSESGETEIDVYYRERGERIPKEICWAGDGLQIYLQILLFAWHYRDHPIVVFDEPDVFLHADLQRRLVRVFEDLDAQVVTATHSPEMLTEASDESVLWIDKSRRKAIRRPDPATLEDLSTQIGSGFNLRLASALRATAVVFVEGKDMKVLRSLAATVGCPRLAAERDIAAIPLGGFTRWVGVEPFKWLVDGFLGSSVKVAVLLDRDYKSDDEVSNIQGALAQVGVHGHVWMRSELENYLISPSAIARLRSDIALDEVEGLIRVAADDVRPDFESQMIAQALKHRGHHDESTVIAAAMAHVRDQWTDLDWLIRSLPGKDLLAALNRALQARGRNAVSPMQLAGCLMLEEVPLEMQDQLRGLEELGRPGA
jgi:predicted ATPase